MADYLLLETDDRLVLEDGTGDLLLESSTPQTAVTDDSIHLGTKDSLGVTTMPILGGWPSW